MEKASKEKFNAAIAHLEHRSPESLRAELKDILETLRDSDAGSTVVVPAAAQPSQLPMQIIVGCVVAALIALAML